MTTDYEAQVREAFAPLFAAAYRPTHRANVEPDEYATVFEARRAETHVGKHRAGLRVVR